MSYNLSRATCERMRLYLDVLLEDGSHTFSTDNPSALAYKLREAMMAAQHHQAFEKYARLRDLYVIRVRPHTVICERAMRDLRFSQVDGAIPINSMYVEQATDLASVVGAATRYPHTQELVFPNVDLPTKDKIKLLKWVGDKEWKYIDHAGEGLTLTKHEVDPDLLWREGDA